MAANVGVRISCCCRSLEASDSSALIPQSETSSASSVCNPLDYYSFQFRDEECPEDDEYLCKVHQPPENKLLRVFTKFESNDLLHYISKLSRPGLVSTAHNESTDSSDEENEPNDAPRISITLSQCTVEDFTARRRVDEDSNDSGAELSDDESSESESKGYSIYINVCKSVMSCILNLKQLVELTLADCYICDNQSSTDQAVLQFGELYNLQLLNLDSMNLVRLHPSVGRLRNLRILSLQYNRLHDLPLTICLLRSLKYLDITGNPFSIIPGAVFRLSRLEVLEGLNFCPLQRNVSGRWQKEKWDISWCEPLLRPSRRTDVESLQDICSRAAIGMDCWAVIPLPERHRQALTHKAITYDLCSMCLKPVKKLPVEHETDAYTICVKLAVFCSQRHVPFRFSACSEDCKNAAVKWLKELQESLEKQYKNSYLPYCTYALQYVQDLPKFHENRMKRLQLGLV